GTLEGDFQKLETSVRNMEAYVTSDTFKVDRAFKNM
ncbi:envelope stress response membrane protein PspC, partial [Vibrio sp. 10N.261.45.A7]